MRATPSLFVGVYAAWGTGSTGSDLARTCERVACSSTSARVGGAIRYRFFPAPHVEPWIGYAAGYEVAGLHLTDGLDEVSMSFTGWELAHLSVGIDYSNDETYAIGPVLDAGFGKYDHFSGDAPGKRADTDITSTALHEWLTIGIRMTFMP